MEKLETFLYLLLPSYALLNWKEVVWEACRIVWLLWWVEKLKTFLYQLLPSYALLNWKEVVDFLITQPSLISGNKR